MSKDLIKVQDKGLSVFASAENFELAQRAAKMLASSTLVPKQYQGKIENCVIALEMAARIGASPLMVMQHLYIVHGNPSWSSAFLISAINTSGKFEPLRFEINGAGDSLECIAWTTDKQGNRLESPKITMAMAKAEGWVQKTGSKWKTMPELMIRYRAAAFFSRLYCPEITMGMQTADEVVDVVYEEVESKSPEDKKADLRAKKEKDGQTSMEMP